MSDVEIEITQHDYDDGYQQLSIRKGEDNWDEVRLYEGDAIEAYYLLRDARIRGHLVYAVIKKISKCVSTTRTPEPEKVRWPNQGNEPHLYA